MIFIDGSSVFSPTGCVLFFLLLSRFKCLKKSGEESRHSPGSHQAQDQQLWRILSSECTAVHVTWSKIKSRRTYLLDCSLREILTKTF